MKHSFAQPGFELRGTLGAWQPPNQGALGGREPPEPNPTFTQPTPTGCEVHRRETCRAGLRWGWGISFGISVAILAQSV